MFLRGCSSTELQRTPWITADAHTVLVANEVALAKGVRPGMALSAAYALARDLEVKRRDPALEAQALRALAAWAGQFTPSVALDEHGLLLEVSGSLKLFAGIEPITAKLRSGITALGFTASLACAPTARAAWWLACAGKETMVSDAAQLPSKLAALSIYTLDWPADTLTMLDAVGVNTLGEVMALPRDGFARRFGQPLLDQLDQALGRAPEAHVFFVPPERFRSRLELPAAVERSDALLFACRRLLVELSGVLAARASGVQQFHLTLEHDDRRETALTFNLVAPGRDATHFGLLVRERFGKLELSAPVYALVLCADTLLPLAGTNLTLFRDKQDGATDWPRLVERLRARLGVTAVHGLSMVAEHRPEYVVRPAAPGTAAPRTGWPQFGERPLWLLAAPQPLIEVDAKPMLRGPLALLAGPERIEAGWWDGDDIARDYFIAQDTGQALLWVYRERRDPGGWFLHGLFA